jgi:P27 family predicted phage terminase small subunit
MKLDSIGRQRQPGQDNGSKKIPTATNGQLTGALTIEDMPPHLGEHGKWFWRQCLRSMGQLGIAENADAHILALACQRYEDMMNAGAAIKVEGSTAIDDKGNTKRNPNWITYEKAATHLKALLGDLGLTPSARAKLGGEPKAQDEFAEMAERGKSRIAQFKATA